LVNSSGVRQTVKHEGFSKEELSTANLQANATLPQTIPRTLVYDGESGYASTLNLSLDVILADILRTRDMFDDNITPCLLKIYLGWAVFDRVRRCGRFNGTWGVTMPDFPLEYSIPRALFVMLKYFGEYNYCGAEYSIAGEVTSKPAGNTDNITASSTGFSKAYSSDTEVGRLYVDSLVKEYYNAAAGTGEDFDGMVLLSDEISAAIATSGMGISYGTLPKNAPDGSAYALVHDGFVTCPVPEFDPYIAHLIGKFATADYNYPRFKKPIVYPTRYVDDGTDLAIDKDVLLTSSTVWVLNRMTEENCRQKNNWNYKGAKLKHPYCEIMQMDNPGYLSAMELVLSELVKSNPNITLAQTWAYHVLCQGALINHLNRYQLFPFGHISSIYWWQYLCDDQYSTMKLPVILARILESIGPVVKDEIIYLPFFDPSFLTASTVSHWSRITTPASWVQNTNMAYQTVGTTVPVGTSITLGNVTIDGSWISLYSGKTCVFPRNLFPTVFDLYSGIFNIVNAGDALVAYVPQDFGGYNMFATGTGLTVPSGTTGSFNQIPVNAGSTLLYTITRNTFPSIVYSSVAIGGKDLMLALFASQTSLESNYFQGWNESPFVFVARDVDPTDTPFSLSTFSLVRNVIKNSITPGSSLMVALGSLKSQQETSTVTIGSLSLSEKPKCETAWCQLFDQTLSIASEGFQTARPQITNLLYQNFGRLAQENVGVVVRDTAVSALASLGSSLASAVGSRLGFG
jgi:hypothetical protein